MCERVFNMLAHVAAARRRSKPPQWALDLVPQEATLKEPEKQQAGAEPSWYVGWCPEHKVAWRCPPSRPQEREVTSEIDAGADDMAPCVARWPDGFSHKIADLLTITWKQSKVPAQQKNNRKNTSVHFRGRTSDGSPVIVKDRPDRGLLVSLYISNKQRLQVKVTPLCAHTVALSVAIGLAERLCKNELEISDLYKARDAELKKMGVLQAPAVKRRPSAAVPQVVITIIQKHRAEVWLGS